MLFNRKVSTALVISMLFGGLWLASAQAQTPAETVQPARADAPASTPLLIAPGDLLHVSVLGAPEFERDVRVGDNGQLGLPMVGDLTVSGLNIAAAEKLIADKLSKGGFYVDPQVSLLVKEYATQGISVMGEVQKPGIYPLIGSHTLFDAISAAGGTTAKAGRTVSITHRNRPQEAVNVPLHSKDGSASSNVPIQPGDTIVVSKAGMVYVVGDVRQPTGIVLEYPNITVLQAISMAQGTNGTAALDRAKILRKHADGTEEIPVPLKQILAAKKPDVMLQPEDVLFVPNSLAKGAARRTFEAAMQSITGIVIYGGRRY